MRLSLLIMCALVSGCSQLDSLLWQPEMTQAQWCEAMPCIQLTDTLVMDQALSTFLVYALGLMWLWAGWRFWQCRQQRACYWWAIAMLLGGIAAISAGTSYQAFGYELKCAGRELCIWTSWYEIAYLVIQNGSMNAMFVAVAYACAQGKWRRLMIAYAAFNMLSYLVVIAVGVYLPNRIMLSFELLVVWSNPAYLLYFLLNGIGYARTRSAKHGALLASWLIMTAVNGLYFAYLLLGYTEQLWAQGIWFSANDVLHVLMMVWVIYTAVVLVKYLDDASEVV